MQCLCLLHLHYAPSLDLTFYSHSVLCLTLSAIFVDVSEESCHSTVVNEHLFFNLPKYYVSKCFSYSYPSVLEKINRMHVLSIPFLIITMLNLYCMKQ